VRNEQVDLGQFVQRGSPVATLYATDYVEIRLPIADKQLAFLDPELVRSGVAALHERPPVRLFASFAGRDWNWMGRLVRTEGEIDLKSRMVHVVARVENPEGDGQAPVPVGLFVNAEIRGQLARGVIELPRVAMRDQSRVLVIDAENRLRFREVGLLRIERDTVLVQSGLEAGERVCVSPLQTVVEGMAVSPIPDTAAAQE
jgi:multidrug efflux pump subunit AcrA (membrane-fusion protein)